MTKVCLYLSAITGDRKTALEYYEKLKLYGDEEEKKLAEAQIKKLSSSGSGAPGEGK